MCTYVYFSLSIRDGLLRSALCNGQKKKNTHDQTGFLVL